MSTGVITQRKSAKRESVAKNGKLGKKSREKRKSRERALSDLGASMTFLGDANVQHDTVINGVIYLEQTIEIEALRQRMAECFASNWRFRSLVKKQGQNFKWILSEEIPDMTVHVTEIDIPTSGEYATQEDIDSFVSSFYGLPMDFSKPLWEAYSIKNVRQVGPEQNADAVLVFRVHHVIGDGISLAAFTQGMYDAEEPDSEENAKDDVKKPKKKKNSNIWPRQSPAEEQLHRARVFIKGIFDGILLPVLPGDSNSIIKRNAKEVGSRRVASSPLVELQKIKEIKDNVGATVNDVLVAALAGVMRKYMEDNGEDVDSIQKVRAGCLINMRSKSETENLVSLKPHQVELGNKFNFLPVHMPVHSTDPLERLYSCKRELDDIKASPAPLLAYGLNQLAGKVLPRDAVLQATHDVFDKLTCVFSNVPLSQTQKRLLGQPVLGMNFFANSLTGTVFSLLSYHGRVQLSIVADTRVVSKPQELVDLFSEEIDVLHKATTRDFKKPKRDNQSANLDVAVVSVALLVFLFLAWQLVR